MDSGLALMLAAAGVGIGHAVLPDHWAPLAVLGRTRRDPLGRVVRRSLVAAVAHVVLSLALGAVLIVIGLRFRETVLRDEDLVVGGLLLATGAVFLGLELAGRGHRHGHSQGHADSHPHPHDHDHDHDHDHAASHDDSAAHLGAAVHDRSGAQPHSHTHPHDSSARSDGRLRAALALAVPFGAAASPDLTILPVFLAAGALGGAAAAGTLVVFAGVTVATIVGLTVAASLGAARLTGPWVERRANLLTAGILVVIGALVALGVI